MEPERTQIEQPGGPVLADQNVGNEVPAQREEHPDPEQPTGGPAEAQVVEQHGGHGDRADAIESGHIATARQGRLRHI